MKTSNIIYLRCGQWQVAVSNPVRRPACMLQCTANTDLHVHPAAIRKHEPTTTIDAKNYKRGCCLSMDGTHEIATSAFVAADVIAEAPTIAEPRSGAISAAKIIRGIYTHESVNICT